MAARARGRVEQIGNAGVLVGLLEGLFMFPVRTEQQLQIARGVFARDDQAADRETNYRIVLANTFFLPMRREEKYMSLPWPG